MAKVSMTWFHIIVISQTNKSVVYFTVKHNFYVLNVNPCLKV